MIMFLVFSILFYIVVPYLLLAGLTLFGVGLLYWQSLIVCVIFYLLTSLVHR